jgi:hypothetical protein
LIKNKKDKVGENTLIINNFQEIIMKIFDPSFLKAEEELDKIRINPAKQPDSETVKNGAD